MTDYVYSKERTLGQITLVLGVIAWLIIIGGTFGSALIFLGVGYLFYLFIQSAFISHLRGNGVELSEKQYPDLYRQYIECCDRLNFTERPKAFILNGDGGMNAFATKFLRTYFVVLLSDIVDAMATHEDGIKFYIGHELGHIKRKHLTRNLLRFPVLWLPLIGAAYSRAMETTCDLHGLACSGSPENAARSLAALSAGSQRWKDIDIPAYLEQNKYSSGFWMSFHELISGYPWITKRVSRVTEPEPDQPKRNGLAYLFAIFVPHSGRMGAGFGLIVMIYIIGVLAAIAIPNFISYQKKAEVAAVTALTQDIRDQLGNHYMNNQTIPTLAEIGISETLPNGSEISINQNDMTLTVTTVNGGYLFIPSIDENGMILWDCQPNETPPAEELLEIIQ